jgi:hypothetical protein
MSEQSSTPQVPSEAPGAGAFSPAQRVRTRPGFEKPVLPPRGSRRRSLALLLLLAVAAITYLAVLDIFGLTSRSSEQTFHLGPENGDSLKIYLEPLSVDAVNDAIEMRLSVAPDRGLRGTRPDVPRRDITVIITASDWSESRVFRSDQPIAPTVIRADLNDGSIVEYPFDRYRVRLGLQAFESDGAASERPLGQQVTVWEGLLGYRFKAHQVQGGDLAFDLRRAGAHIFFAVAAYGAMIVLACNSLAISCLVFLGLRRAEANLVGALAALVFALPALRDNIPGAPPLGVWADLAVFLWAELAAVIASALVVLSWARQADDRR